MCQLSSSDGETCLCGEPPYTDGHPCPACFEIIAAETMADPDATLDDLIMLLVLAGRDEADDETP